MARCRVHKPRVPNGPASQQKLGSADDIANNAQFLGRPRYPIIGQKGDLVSDRKAWPRRVDARFRLRPASPTRRLGQGGTTLASDRKACPRKGRCSLSTSTRFSDREYTEPLLTALLRPARSELTGKQPNRDARLVKDPKN